MIFIFGQLLRQALPRKEEDGGDNETGMDGDSQVKEEAAKAEKLRRKRMAQEQRAKMMAKMNNMQQAFMKSNKGFFAEDMEVDG